jgi:hypothetical protein
VTHVAIVETPYRHALSRCHGYRVDADDGPAGVVETPVCVFDSEEADYLMVRVHVAGRLFPRLPLVPVSLVHEIDQGAGRIKIGTTRAALEQMPEQPPLVL